MTAPIYLYGYGKRRHILNPCGAPVNPGVSGTSFCGGWHFFDAEMELHVHRWDGYGPYADRQIARQRALPICKRCQASWDREMKS